MRRIKNPDIIEWEEVEDTDYEYELGENGA